MSGVLTPLELATRYAARGVSVIPVPARSKAPTLKGWPDLRLTIDDLPRHFNGHPSNIGALMGEPSGGLIDIDLDCPEAVALADAHLPECPLIFGREGRPRSHRLHWVDGPVSTRKWQSPSGVVLFELRSTGTQTIMPGSVHPSGEAIRWDHRKVGRNTIDAAALLRGCEALYAAVLAARGESMPRVATHTTRAVGGSTSVYGRSALERECALLASTPEGGRHDQCFRSAASIGELVAGGEIDRGDAEAALLDAAEACGLPERDAHTTIRDGLHRGAQSPRTAPQAPIRALDSIAPIERNPVQSNSGGYRLVPIGELAPAADPKWIMPEYIARAHLTLLVGLWKSGKSTMLGHLLKDLYQGGGLATPEAVDWPTLIMSEESDGQWSNRRDELELDPERILLCKRPSFARPSMDGWLSMMDQLTEDVRQRGIGLVVFDTIANLWPLADENDATAMGTVLAPMKDLAAAGAGVVLVHHPKKTDSGEATVSRGSGALPAFVDAIVELRRSNPHAPGDPRRTLTGYARWDVPAAQVIELTPGVGYRLLGGADELRSIDLRDTIRRNLPTDESKAMTAAEIRAGWPTEHTPSESVLRGSLVKGSADGLWCKRGTGNRGDAYRFWLPPDPERVLPE